MTTPADLAAALVDPVATWSAVAGPPTIVVDGDFARAEPPPAGAGAPPVVLVARVREPVGTASVPLVQACDVIVADDPSWCPGAVGGGDEAVARLEAAVADAPDAAVTLCQLIRGTGILDVASGLLAESLAYGVLQGSTRFAAWLDGRTTSRRPGAAEGRVWAEREGSVLRVTLDRPGVHNALDTTMRDDLVAALAPAATDPTIELVELRGAGPSFCSGGDLVEFGTAHDPATAHLVRSTRLPARSVARVADRVTAFVHGTCVGAGVELAAFAWEVEAAPGTTFRLPEVGMGLVPGSGGTVSLPRRIGRHRTAWLALSGDVLDLDRALAWGLVDRVGG